MSESYKGSRNWKACVDAARALLAGDIEFVSGVRQLDLALCEADLVDLEPYLTIAGVDSDMDGTIIGEGRKLYAQEYLDRVDRRMAEYIPRVRDAVREACSAIIDHFENDPVAVTLYRPVGPEELALIADSGYSKFPPRLMGQPIFYPVLIQSYAEEIASKWNAKESEAGYVLRFDVRRMFLNRYVVQKVGNRTHLEYWIPAEDLDEFNANIVGPIKLIKSFVD